MNNEKIEFKHLLLLVPMTEVKNQMGGPKPKQIFESVIAWIYNVR